MCYLAIIIRIFAKITQNLKLNTKLFHDFFFGFFIFVTKLFTRKVLIIHENVITFFIFFENSCFTQSSSSSSSSFIYKVVIIINTWTINKQFEALNASKQNLDLNIRISYTHKPFSFHFLFYFIPKSQIFISKFICLLELLKFLTLGQERVSNFY